MKSEWPIVPMGELCSIESGASDTKDAVSDGPYAFFDRSKKIKRSTRFLYDCEALIIPGEGAEFFPKQFSGKFDLHQRAYALFDFGPELDIRFLFHYLHHRADYFPSVAVGATVKSLRRRHFLDLPVPIPPLPEQQRIVGILDEAFAAIAIAKANTEKNLANARAVFESHLQAVFTQRGEGWTDHQLGDVCEFVRGPFGGSLKKEVFVSDGYAVYEQQHAIYQQFSDIRYFVNETKFREMQRFELRPNDLIMSCSGTMGRVAVVPNGIKRGIINQALLKLTPGRGVSSHFLKRWMDSEAFQDALKQYSGGAAIQNVASVKILKEIRLPLPSIARQAEMVAELDNVSEEAQRLEFLYKQKLASLDALKQSLLHHAFIGQLRSARVPRTEEMSVV